MLSTDLFLISLVCLELGRAVKWPAPFCGSSNVLGTFKRGPAVEGTKECVFMCKAFC